MYKNNNNTSQPQLTIAYGGTTYVTIVRTAQADGAVTITTSNNALVKEVSGSAWNNSDNANNLTTVQIWIPATGPNSSGTLLFGFTRGSATNSLRMDNIDILAATTTVPNCASCLPMNIGSDGSVNTGDAPPTPECNQTTTSQQYIYYLPAVAAMPGALNATDSSSPAEIQITTEVTNANIVVRRPEGIVVQTAFVTSSAMLTIPTTLNDMFQSSYNTPYTGKGYIIESDQPLTVRWSLQHVNNRELVVLRGKLAVGKAFRLASIMNADRSTATNQAEGNHYYTVMALENNTRVQIGNIYNAVSASNFTFVTLQKGQQYTGIHNTIAMSGRLVLADKPIVVSSGQQHKRIMRDNGVGTDTTSTSLEGTVLQLPPTYSLGKEYVLVNTEGFYGHQVVATNNGTAVYRDGEIVAYLNAGEQYQYFIKSLPLDLLGKPYTISTSQPAYVYNIGTNEIGEFELFPAPPVDLPVGKAGKIMYAAEQGLSGWVIVDQVDAGKLKRNNNATLGATKQWLLPARNGVAAKTVYYWDSTFAPQVMNEITCTNCNAMYVGQLNDGGTSGAQIGYVSSFDASPIQFFNSEFLPAELLTNGYVFDTVNYHYSVPSTIEHTITLASSGGAITIDSIVLKRISGNTQTGSVQSINNANLTFILNIPPASSVLTNTKDTVLSTVYVRDEANNVAALCLSYILENQAPLPVELSYFTAEKSGSQSLLKWTTSSESNNSGFYIQRSTDGTNWKELGWVAAASGSQSDLDLNYHFTDPQPASGNNYYRLKQVDLNGNFEFSRVRTLNFTDYKDEIKVYPNPTNQVIFVEGVLESSTIRIYNNTGQMVIEIRAQQGVNKIEMTSLPVGVYQMQVTDQKSILQNKKIIVTH